MTPSEYKFRLQRGINSGFGPPAPSAICTIVKSARRPNIDITRTITPYGCPYLVQNPTHSINPSKDHAQALVDELYSILNQIPTPDPPGSQDIYGLDTSISWASEDFHWEYVDHYGVGEGESEVQPTQEQRERYMRAIEIVEMLASRKE